MVLEPKRKNFNGPFKFKGLQNFTYQALLSKPRNLEDLLFMLFRTGNTAHLMLQKNLFEAANAPTSLQFLTPIRGPSGGVLIILLAIREPQKSQLNYDTYAEICPQSFCRLLIVLRTELVRTWLASQCVVNITLKNIT